jgi:hypothetical protein
MKSRFITLALLALFTAGCSGEPEVKPRPDDFSFQYNWAAGSMPPPYHYEYTIQIGPGPFGKATLVPNYPGADVPVWTEDFTITEQQLDDLYNLVTQKNMLRNNWREMSSPPVGGSTHWAAITAGGERYTVPSTLETSEEVVVDDVYESVMAMVPSAQWSKLLDQRAEYERDYQKNRP